MDVSGVGIYSLNPMLKRNQILERNHAETRRANAVASVNERLDVISALSEGGKRYSEIELYRQAETIVSAVLALTREPKGDEHGAADIIARLRRSRSPRRNVAFYRNRMKKIGYIADHGAAAVSPMMKADDAAFAALAACAIEAKLKRSFIL